MATPTLIASDRLQSPLLVQRSTNRIAAAYTPYGQRSPSSFPTALGFTGQPFEQALDGYVLGSYRVYSTRLMRFLSGDSWSPFGGGGLNAYCYCRGNPVDRRDPTGHIVVDPYTAAKAGFFITTNAVSLGATLTSPPPQDELGVALNRAAITAPFVAFVAQAVNALGVTGADLMVVASTATGAIATAGKAIVSSLAPGAEPAKNVKANVRAYFRGVNEPSVDVESGGAALINPPPSTREQGTQTIDLENGVRPRVNTGSGLRRRRVGVVTQPDLGHVSGGGQDSASPPRSPQSKKHEIRDLSD
ncbi:MULTISPECIES: RHS repeat-associated core domain-containing protein [unclassified Pseudomonas]|uniref:RHS repeat-associated core domain-containing protein n=1 Tax=unclassified Pseudomonas TaxID=196821 RepID=UPI001E456822|nr:MULTISPECIES: RHS repeat-associated core domain-containing protein [unclassified Pseudomonas]MCE0913865.1 RHS repeat-associated core domain-containing protein [Pseudomonas sp. NMI760_13]MCP8634047.1 RHS repeat-associated core domain-containing protein [Pseudomonas sp. DVZ6]MDD7784032.1 RHS repeat-associated core domain-containing protein [Pseudomonas sp. DVZ24]